MSKRQRPITIPRKAILVWLSPNARKAIEEAAAKDDRSLSNFLAHYGEDAANRILDRKKLCAQERILAEVNTHFDNKKEPIFGL